MKAWDTAGASLKGRSAPRCIRVCFSILSNCATIIADGIIVGRKIGTDGLTAITGLETHIPCDAVINAADMLPNLDLIDGISVKEVYAVGDCASPFNIGRAVQTGNDAGRAV